MRFVLMIPLRRCGSNAIRLRMNLHSEFYSPYPLHLCDIEKPDPDTLKDDLVYFQWIVNMIGLQRHSLVAWEDVHLDPVSIWENIKNKPRSIYQIYWEMLSQAGQIHNASVVMDKCQDSVCDFEELVGICPNMLFLDVVRDPRAQISSMNQSILYEFDTFLNTERWVESRQWVDRLRERFPEKVLTIRYEDFILKQEHTLRTVCRFVGIPFDPIVLDVQLSQEAYHMASLSPLWKTNFDNPISHYIHKYRDSLSSEEIGHIEHHTWKWMKQYDYSPEIHHPSTLPYDRETALLRSNEKKNAAWIQLQQNYPYDYVLRKSRYHYLKHMLKK